MSSAEHFGPAPDADPLRSASDVAADDSQEHDDVGTVGMFGTLYDSESCVRCL